MPSPVPFPTPPAPRRGPLRRCSTAATRLAAGRGLLDTSPGGATSLAEAVLTAVRRRVATGPLTPPTLASAVLTGGHEVPLRRPAYGEALTTRTPYRSVAGDPTHAAPPAWHTQGTGRRHHVGIATGMLIGESGTPVSSSTQALVLPRSHAHGRAVSLDDVAHDLVTGRATVAELQEPS